MTLTPVLTAHWDETDSYTIDGYRRHVAWEPWPAMETLTAALLPGLLLARIDGKSPVEYLTDEPDRASVRDFARARLSSPVSALGEIAHNWRLAG